MFIFNLKTILNGLLLVWQVAAWSIKMSCCLYFHILPAARGRTRTAFSSWTIHHQKASWSFISCFIPNLALLQMSNLLFNFCIPMHSKLNFFFSLIFGMMKKSCFRKLLFQIAVLSRKWVTHHALSQNPFMTEINDQKEARALLWLLYSPTRWHMGEDCALDTALLHQHFCLHLRL